MLVSFHSSVLALKWAYLPTFLLKLLLFLSVKVKVFETRSNNLVWPIFLHSALSKHWLSLWYFNTPVFIFNTWWVFFWMLLSLIKMFHNWAESLWLYKTVVKHKQITFSEDWETWTCYTCAQCFQRLIFTGWGGLYKRIGKIETEIF